MDEKELRWELEKEKAKVKALELELRKRGAEVADKKAAIVRLTEEIRPYKENVKLLGDSLDARVKELKEKNKEITELKHTIDVGSVEIARWMNCSNEKDETIEKLRALLQGADGINIKLNEMNVHSDNLIRDKDATIALLRAVPKDSSWKVGYENGLSNKDDEWRKRIIAVKAVVDAEYAQLDSDYSVPDCPLCILYGQKKALESLLGGKEGG